MAAVLLTGLGRLATLPPFDDFDETAHYSRIEAAAFAPRDADASFLSADVVDYARHGPMTPWWIRTQAILPAYNKAVDTGKPLKRDLTETLKAQGYKDFRAFFSNPGLTPEYIHRYAEEPGPHVYTASQEGNWEYQHPALYYLVMGHALRLIAGAPLLTRLLILRSLSFLMAAAGLAIGGFATLRHLELRGRAQAADIAALGAFYPFAMPVFFPEFARLGNDSLCLLLFSFVWALLLWHLRRPREVALWALLGVAMGYTWLAKAFMIPISCGLLAFMALQPPPAGTGPEAGGIRRLFFRLQPALTAGIAAFVIGFWPYAPGSGGAHGSIEISDFLHGRGILAGDGLPWKQMFWDPLYMLASAVFNVTDVKAVYAPATLIVSTLALLAGIFVVWLKALPRDVRRDEWLPLYALLPMAAGLGIHSIISVITYRSVGTTPGHYFHVEAPALALIFGAGLLSAVQRRGGAFFGALLFAAAALATLLTLAFRLPLFTGCEWLSDNFVNLNIDWSGEACRPAVIYERLGVFSWPAAGLPMMAAGFILFAGAAVAALRKYAATLKTA